MAGTASSACQLSLRVLFDPTVGHPSSMTQLLSRPVAATSTNFGPVVAIQRILKVKTGQCAIDGLFQADCIHAEGVEDQLAEKHILPSYSAGGLFLEDLLKEER